MALYLACTSEKSPVARASSSASSWQSQRDETAQAPARAPPPPTRARSNPCIPSASDATRDRSRSSCSRPTSRHGRAEVRGARRVIESGGLRGSLHALSRGAEICKTPAGNILTRAARQRTRPRLGNARPSTRSGDGSDTPSPRRAAAGKHGVELFALRVVRDVDDAADVRQAEASAANPETDPAPSTAGAGVETDGAAYGVYSQASALYSQARLRWTCRRTRAAG